MGADPLQGYRVPAQRKEARSKCGFELEDPGTVSVHLRNCHDQSWGARELQGEYFPGESFSTVGRAEGPRDGVEGLGLCSYKEWRNGEKGWCILKEKR